MSEFEENHVIIELYDFLWHKTAGLVGEIVDKWAGDIDNLVRLITQYNYIPMSMPVFFYFFLRVLSLLLNIITNLV